MLKFMKKVVYYGTLVMPIYNFLKDVCQTGYALYINHLQEIETAKMRARFNSDELESVSVEEVLKAAQEIINKKKGSKK